MPKLPPLPDWTGQRVFILGGGYSLRKFDFSQLKAFPTVGCNHAFILGADVCKICVFGDFKFWNKVQLEKKELESFGGWVATNFNVPKPPPWLRVFGRIDHGFGCNGTLAWNNNTGAMSVNLALALGASEVCLLGFDCSMKGQYRTHWHDRRLSQPSLANYDRFKSGFDTVAQQYKRFHPDSKVVNVSSGESQLRAFQTVTFEDVGLVAPHRECAVPVCE